VSWIYAHRYLIARRIVAVGTLGLFWLGAHAHLGELTGNLSSSRLFRTVPLSDPFAVLQILATGQPLASTVLVGAMIVLIFYALLGGRAFCGWVCPVGLIGDATRWWKRHFKIRGQFRIVRSVRFWIAALALPVSAATGVAAFEWMSPIGIIQRELIYGAGLGAAMIVAVIILVDLFVARDGWCGSLCPLGAFYSVIGHFSLLRVRFDAERCDRCGDCAVVCPEPQVIDFHAMSQKRFIESGDCLNCGRCLEVCPREAYRFAPRPIRGATSDLTEGGPHATKNAE
jgi:ferredoxin-type protein NapH